MILKCLFIAPSRANSPANNAARLRGDHKKVVLNSCSNRDILGTAVLAISAGRESRPAYMSIMGRIVVPPLAVWRTPIEHFKVEF